MTVRAKLTTSGFSEYLEKLAQAGKDVDQAAAAALEAGGDVLLEGMQRRVPKDTHNLEQHLERTEPEQDGNYVFVLVGLNKDADADTARYGNAQEYGTSSMTAQPYIRPTLDSDMGAARKTMKKVLEENGTL
jgi:HK97 gp10 family phage protein